ncbi:unnamed protein product [Durusdinium trenchii]|uniref:Uncharacterized protein n=1 Tax=Durusdinium trenchii TaxID=1381693 RepID=A0ABP0NR78_9DINO
MPWLSVDGFNSGGLTHTSSRPSEEASGSPAFLKAPTFATEHVMHPSESRGRSMEASIRSSSPSLPATLGDVWQRSVTPPGSVPVAMPAVQGGVPAMQIVQPGPMLPSPSWMQASATLLPPWFEPGSPRSAEPGAFVFHAQPRPRSSSPAPSGQALWAAPVTVQPLFPAANPCEAASSSPRQALMRPVRIVRPQSPRSATPPRTATPSQAGSSVEPRKQAAKDLCHTLKVAVHRQMAGTLACWRQAKEDRQLVDERAAELLARLNSYDERAYRRGRVASILATAVAAEGRHITKHCRALALLLGLRQLQGFLIRPREEAAGHVSRAELRWAFERLRMRARHGGSPARCSEWHGTITDEGFLGSAPAAEVATGGGACMVESCFGAAIPEAQGISVSWSDLAPSGVSSVSDAAPIGTVAFGLGTRGYAEAPLAIGMGTRSAYAEAAPMGTRASGVGTRASYAEAPLAIGMGTRSAYGEAAPMGTMASGVGTRASYAEAPLAIGMGTRSTYAEAAPMGTRAFGVGTRASYAEAPLAIGMGTRSAYGEAAPMGTMASGVGTRASYAEAPLAIGMGTRSTYAEAAPMGTRASGVGTRGSYAEAPLAIGMGTRSAYGEAAPMGTMASGVGARASYAEALPLARSSMYDFGIGCEASAAQVGTLGSRSARGYSMMSEVRSDKSRNSMGQQRHLFLHEHMLKFF